MKLFRPRAGARALATPFLCAGIVAGLAAPHAAAQPPAAPASGASAASPFGALRWRSLGPLRGGRSIGVAGSDARPHEYYFGATGGGLWKTTDGGTTWRPVTDGFLNSSSVGAVAVAPSNPDVVYIGMGEAQLRGNIAQGDGVYKSTDAGRTWKHVGLKDSQTVSRLRVHPTNADLVYAAVLGHPSGPNDERGVYRSKDGGTTWERVLFRDAKTGAVDIALDPNNAAVIYATLWESFRMSHMMSSGGPGSGIFKSTNGGDTWTEISRNPGLPKGVLGKMGIAVSGADSNRVYAQIEAEDGGLFVSDDAGATWKMVDDRRDRRQRAFYYTRVYADPKAKDTVYVLNVGFHKSTDGGKTWSQIRVPHGDNHDLWISTTDPKRMVQGNDGGGNVSVNGGETWTEQDYPTSQFYHVTTTTHVPYHVCGAQQDNSTACVSSQQSENPFGERTAPIFYSAGGGESGYIASRPDDPDVFYAGSYGGYLTKFDRRTGQQRAINPYPDNPMGYPSGQIAERFQWTFPIVINPHDPNELYVGSQHLWMSTNEGQSWTKVSPDLSRGDPSTMGDSGGPITKDHTGVETYGTIFTFSISPKDRNVMWAGSDDGYVHVTKDNKKTWTNVTPKDLPPFARVSIVDASPHRPGTAYVAANVYGRGDFAPYVYRTDDYGANWTKIVNGVAARDFARAIREDLKRPRMLYLGTENGIYVSFDDGANWQSLRQNLSTTPVHDIAVTDRDLVIGTHGRGFYVMDNIQPLRDHPSAIQAGALHVYRVPSVRRGLDRAAAIDYRLGADANEIKVEILDAQGGVIRTFTNTKAEVEAARNRPAGAPNPEAEFFRGPRDPKPSIAKGHQRVSWDLRYPGATEFPGMIMWAASTRGPLAPTGQYQVRVTADGVSQTQPFTIERETTLLKNVTDADLQAQFDLAMQVRNRTSQANDAVLLIRGIKQQIDDRVKKLDTGKPGSKPSPALVAARDVAAKLSAVEGEIYQVKNQSSQDPLNFPIKLNNKIAALQGVIESADARPTDQSREMYQTLSAKLDVQLQAMDKVIKTDLPKLSQLLRGRRLDAITVAPLKTDNR